jgi:hypothetical protein
MWDAARELRYLIVWDESFFDKKACPLLQDVVVLCQIIDVISPLSVSQSHDKHIAA